MKRYKGKLAPMIITAGFLLVVGYIFATTPFAVVKAFLSSNETVTIELEQGPLDEGSAPKTSETEGLSESKVGILAEKIFSDDGLKRIIDVFEETYNTYITQKNTFVEVNGLVHRMLFKKEMNGIYRLENGHTTALTEEADPNGISANAQALTAFSEWFEQEKGGDFLYVQVPHKNAKYGSVLPKGISDYSNQNANALLDKIKGKVNVLDLRECIREDAVDPYSLFLKTEHHWNPEGAFYGFQKICEYLQEQFDQKIDPQVLSLENYHQDVLKERSIGYYGSRCGQWFTGYDDFTVICPEFETEQICTIPHKDVVRSGSFYDAIFDLEKLDLPKKERGLYSMYIGGDYPLVIHESKTAKNPGTIMLFIDSFGTLPESFLTTVYQHVIAVDLRWVKLQRMKETAVDFVNYYNPDIVVVAFNPNQIGDASASQFNYGVP